MNHIQVIRYHRVDYWNIAPIDLDINTSGNIWPTVLWCVDSSIHYTLTINFLPNYSCCVILFIISIVIVVHCGSYLHRETICDSCLLGDWNKYITTHGTSISIVYLSSFFPCSNDCFYEYNIQDINLGQSTPYRMHYHMTPQTRNFWRNWGSLDFKRVDRQILILHYFLTSNMMSLLMWNFGWLDHPSIGCYTTFAQIERGTYIPPILGNFF